jgi:hypothetical protein
MLFQAAALRNERMALLERNTADGLGRKYARPRERLPVEVVRKQRVARERKTLRE